MWPFNPTPRVMEADVARILSIIAAPPNLRQQPKPDDMQGEHYEEWFDGGAISHVTGCTYYDFKDGTRAMVGVVGWLSVSIDFPDGTEVDVEQQRQS